MYHVVFPVTHLKSHTYMYKATQHNSMTPEEDFFQRKSAASGGTRTHDTLLSRLSALPTRGSAAGWDESYNVIQIKARQSISKQLNLINNLSINQQTGVIKPPRRPIPN